MSVCSMAMSAQATESKININGSGIKSIRGGTFYLDNATENDLRGININGDYATDLELKITGSLNLYLNNSNGGTIKGITTYDSYANNVHLTGDDIKITTSKSGSAYSVIGIHNPSGKLEIDNNINIINNRSRVFNGIANSGTLVLNGEVSILDDAVGGYLVNNTGRINMIGKEIFLYTLSPDTNIIYNNTELKIGSDTSNVIIKGSIQTMSSALTELNINTQASSFYGNIHGTSPAPLSNGYFKLNIDNGGVWIVGNDQNEAVRGVTLNKGTIRLNDEAWTSNNTKYKQLELLDFNTNGQGYIQLATDLANDLGDRVIFSGTTPNSSVSLRLLNKNDNNGIAIKPSDGHSVTVARVETGSNLKINVDQVYFANEDQIKFARPIVDTLEDGGNKYYNFVGWQSDNADGVLDKQLPSNEPYINTNELDNVFKRVMDIRNDPSEVGVWIRGETGKMKIDGYGYDYNLTSGGHDWKHENNAGILFGGFGITHSVNKCDSGIIGDTKSTGYNLYGSWLGKDNNDYVDVILKYGKMDKTYAGLDKYDIFAAGSYSKDVLSIAAKYGRRYEMRNDWYYEPFAGLTWGKISDVDFKDARGFNIHGDSVTSKIANLGMQVGKKMDKRDFYYRMNLVHDFDGKMHVNVPGTTTAAYTDMGGTWLKCAIGTSAKVGKNNSYYIDLEKDFGNKVEKPWSISAGYRHTW